MPVPLAESTRETVKLLYLQGLEPKTIAQQTGVKHQTIVTWSKRHGWTSIRNTTTGLLQSGALKGLISSTTAHLKDASAALRGVFADTLSLHANALGKVAVKSDLKHLKAVGEAIEPLVRSAKIVHDWGSGSVQGVILAGELTLDRDPHALRPVNLSELKSANVTPEAAEPTTGSVQDKGV